MFTVLPIVLTDANPCVYSAIAQWGVNPISRFDLQKIKRSAWNAGVIEPVIYFLAVEVFIWVATYSIIYVAFDIYERYRCFKLIDSANELYLDGTPEKIAWENMIWEHRKEISRINNVTGRLGAWTLVGLYLMWSLLKLLIWFTHS